MPYAPEPQVGAKGELLRKGDGTYGFSFDFRNYGGRKILNDLMFRHRNALQQIKSPISDQMKPPHAFIDNCKQGKTEFVGMKKKRPISTILTRKRKNIDNEL